MTDDQRRAIESVSGDLAISAGAGSGKTTVLAHRFARAMLPAPEQEWDPAPVDRILTITFTNKAAGEIAERVRRVVGSELSAAEGRRVTEAWISTIHTFCGRLVRRHLLESGVEPRFTQVDEIAAGLLKAEAFESAACSLYGAHDGASRLLDTTELPTLRAEVISVHDNIRAMGLEPGSMLVPDGVDELDGLVVRAQRGAETLACALEQCKPTDSVKRSRGRLDEWSAGLSACALGDEDSCLRLIATCDDYDIKGVRGDAKIANDALRAAIQTMRSAAMAASFPDILEGYRALVAGFAERYAELKRDRSALDFDDLQERAVGLLSTNPEIARRYRKHFRMVMIDEFQDTNELQLRVIAPLRDDNLCVVGDEHQSIYGFRYADVGVFERLREETSAKIELKENFRSHAQILAFVNSAFSQPHLFGAGFMKLGAGRSEQAPGPLAELSGRVECVFVDNPDRAKAPAVAEEARLVASRIRQLTEAGVSGGQIAILLRNATNAGVFASALESEDVAVLAAAGATLFDAVEVREVMALLRAIAVPADDERLAEVLASRVVHVSDDALLSLRLSAAREPLWTAVRAVGEGLAGAADLSQHDAAAVRVAYRAIDDLGSRQGTLSLHELVHAACAAFDYDLTLLSLGPSGLRAWSNVLKIARYAAQYEQIESSDPAAFVDYLKQRSDGARDREAAAEAGGDAVRIMTIHSAKGLEFPVVFVADLGAAKLRSPGNVLVAKVGEGESATPVVGLRFKCGDDGESGATALHGRLAQAGQAKDLEEQKRCLYVASTRAQDLLVVSGVSNLGKPAEQTSAMIGWIREAVGDPGASGAAHCGDTEVQVTVASASEEQKRPTPACVTGDVLLFDEVQESPSEPLVRGIPQKVSYSALRTHEQCPLSYRVRYELRLGEFRAPSDSRASDFGSAFHSIMQTACGGEPVPDSIDAATARYRLGDAGRARLTSALEAFDASPLSARLAQADRVECEEPIRISVGGSALGGSIDVLAWTGDEALVLDYKTGRAPSGETKSRMAGYELQARCYALAAFEAGARRVEAVFCFVEQGAQGVSFDFSVEDAPAIRADIERRIKAIVEQPVTHLAEYDPEACAWCPALGGVCPIDPP